MTGTATPLDDPQRGLRLLLQAFCSLGPRGWLFVLAGSVVALVLIDIPTAIIETPFFGRMTPIRDQDYAIWVATAVLAGLITGTFGAATESSQKAFASGGVLSAFAVGCPVCNKLIVLLIGTSGALTFFAPLQLYLGLAGPALLGWTLWLRVNAMAGNCPARY